ncbi:acyl-CoA dehydrogenase family protein [Mycolicibacterium llatzerense]|uniref:Acyl-CoA dehydrogenase n=1 Tax=Mycolicibacterium llatzerense TaxID=280871 RepID=A0A0D1J2T7_9MYCO|nr:acyl-CoA dehydrogenase family protein [Mycolicibacterium llatzerense]KIU15883.1 acyl-CoA dehydrogenase [Mycolicibacterium llatzerense]
MTVNNALAGGVFDAGPIEPDDHTALLRDLVDQLGKRSFDSRVGRRSRPDVFDDTLWRRLEDTALERLTTTADVDAGPAEVATLLYGLARHAAAVPIAETDLLAAWLGRQSGLELPRRGPMTVAIADATTTRNHQITGTATDVPWAATSTIVVLARIADIHYTGLLSEPDIRGGHNLAGEPRDTVRFTMPTDHLRAVGEQVHAELCRRGAWARCMQMMGALDASAALTLAHTRERKQFGRALSDFQSVQHALAAMAGQIERGRAVATLAVAAASDFGFASQQTDFAVTVAKTVLGRAAADVITIAHQLHGAIGITAEHPLWLFTTRLRSWSDDYGTAVHHAQRLGHAALAASSAWDLTIGSGVQYSGGRLR